MVFRYGVRMMIVGNGPPSAGIQTSPESSTPSRMGVRMSNMRLTWPVCADAGAVAAGTRAKAIPSTMAARPGGRAGSTEPTVKWSGRVSSARIGSPWHNRHRQDGLQPGFGLASPGSTAKVWAVSQDLACVRMHLLHLLPHPTWYRIFHLPRHAPREMSLGAWSGPKR